MIQFCLSRKICHSATLVAIASLLGLAACSKNEMAQQGSGEEETESFITPVLTVSSQDIVLSKANGSKTALSLSWTSAVPKNGKSKVTYKVYVNSENKDIYSESPEIFIPGTGLSYAFSNKELNNLALKLGISAGATGSLNVAVYAFSSQTSGPVAFSVETVSVTTYSDAPKRLVTPELGASSSNIFLYRANSQITALTLTWTSARPENENIDVSYQVFVSNADRDPNLELPEVFHAGTGQSYEFSHTDLYDLAVMLGIAPKATGRLNIAVYASSSYKFEPAQSSTQTVMVTPYSTGGGSGDPSVATPETYLNPIRDELVKQWPKNRTINFVFHGHSVPSGYAKTPIVNTLEAYPYQTLVQIKKYYPYAVVNTITTSIGGENSETGAARFERDVLTHQPDVLFIDYALNDRGIGVERAEKAWRKMIEATLARNIKLILCTPTPDLTANISSSTDPLTLQADMIRGLAAEYHVGLADTYAEFKKIYDRGESLTSYMAQNNHPNAKGHQVAISAIVPWIIPAQ